MRAAFGMRFYEFLRDFSQRHGVASGVLKSVTHPLEVKVRRFQGRKAGRSSRVVPSQSSSDWLKGNIQGGIHFAGDLPAQFLAGQAWKLM